MAHSVHKSESMGNAATEVQSEPQSGVMAVLRNRNFLFLWLAQVFSQLAQQIINFALVVQVYDLTNSSTANAIVLICFTIPGILFSAIAGVFVDRTSKRNVLVATNVARGAIMLLFIFTAVQRGPLVAYILPVIYLLTLIFSSVSQFFVPAEGAAIPMLVKRNELIAANSLFNLTFTAAQLLGFVFLGPFLTSVFGYRTVYIVLFIFYIICVALTWFLPKDEQHREEPQQKISIRSNAKLAWEELKEGWAFIRNDPPLVTAITYWSIAITVFFMLATLGQAFLQSVLGIPPEQLSFILMPGGIGLVLGVVLVGRFATEQNRTKMILLSMVGASILLLLFALLHDTLGLVAGWLGQPPPPVVVSQILMGVLAFFLGLLNSFITVPAQTILQERSPEQIRARVFSAFYTVSNTLLLVPVVLATTLSDLFGVVQTIVVISILMLILCGVGYFRSFGPNAPRPAPSLEPGDRAAETFVPGSVPLPLDDERERALHIGDDRPNDGEKSA